MSKLHTHFCRSHDDPNSKLHWAAGETVPLDTRTEGVARWFFDARHPSGLACPDEGMHEDAVEPTSPAQKGCLEAKVSGPEQVTRKSTCLIVSALSRRGGQRKSLRGECALHRWCAPFAAQARLRRATSCPGSDLPPGGDRAKASRVDSSDGPAK